MPMKKKDIDKLLSRPIVAVVAVTAPDGSPHAVPTWYEYDKGEIIFQSGPEAFKYKCLVRDPRVTFVVDTKEAPYKSVVLKGRVTMEEKIDDKRTERMAIEYLGKKMGKRYAKSMSGEKVVVIRFKPERTISWDYAEEAP
ncbi:MAG TPA: TIGR03618 family F420-dependent PPOX class oxidoreductase [Candidatus Binataceae bacterium]|nr:TIGR03618 family F420-dependent PPOX class oxidoreductase [Candidatus Binataceae bacterium]